MINTMHSGYVMDYSTAKEWLEYRKVRGVPMGDALKNVE